MRCAGEGGGCFATSTKEIGNRNIISTIQFAAREKRGKRDMLAERSYEREGKQEGSGNGNQSDRRPRDNGRGKIPMKRETEKTRNNPR